ncbi:uncharacterized protein MONBRDRAFT_34519 [Monosiga brevicollis MX1]|uniref:Integrator complex subunit 6-like beta-barrel domain-containing protein n=1 Tax=Monosiga brevicollis TaxID=81824 RepID=A9VC93_MONBE|nr:uncharacterized protein MONBRDRAFT_34519 [Monosiga brevicollis MX1]EDQ84860.1 predicted protein [Monosiga brevicollis MX1]|eukprot:XP_001750361.1 hypothetical protein [Monosiga brevicollis MX1]
MATATGPAATGPAATRMALLERQMAAVGRGMFPDLPESCQVLCSPRATVILIGSAHVSQKSVDEVLQVIRTYRPPVVAVELCRERAGMLKMNYSDTSALQQAEPDFAEIVRIVQQGNSATIAQLFVQSLYSWLATKLKIEVMPECESYGGSVVLLDRPVSVTLNRTMGNLTFWDKVRFLFLTISDLWSDLSLEDVERMRKTDVVSQMIQEVTEAFPRLAQPLIAERDAYITHVLNAACNFACMMCRNTEQYLLENMMGQVTFAGVARDTFVLPRESMRSPSNDLVVAVVGAGHVEGIKRLWYAQEGGVLDDHVCVKQLMARGEQPTSAMNVIFVIDTSASMHKQTPHNMSCLDTARIAILNFVKARSQTSHGRYERYSLLSYEQGSQALKCWNQPLPVLELCLQELSYTDCTSPTEALFTAFRLLHVTRMPKDCDTYGQGRQPWNLLPAVIIHVSDGGGLTTAQGPVAEPVLPAPDASCGMDLTVEPFRWDVHLYSINLNISVASTVRNRDRPERNLHDPLRDLCNATGGEAFNALTLKGLSHSLDHLGGRLIPSIIVNLQAKQLVNLLVAQPRLTKLTRDLALHPRQSKSAPSNMPSEARQRIWVRPDVTGKLHGTWMIPEDYAPERGQRLRARSAFPILIVEPHPQAPIVVQGLPFDKYELEASALTKWILSHKSTNICFHCRIKQTLSGPEGAPDKTVLSPPFAYLKPASTRKTVNLVVLPMNFPALDALMRQHKASGASIEWQEHLQTFAAQVPYYYHQPLRAEMCSKVDPAASRWLSVDKFPGRLPSAIANTVNRHKTQCRNEMMKIFNKLQTDQAAQQLHQSTLQTGAQLRDGATVDGPSAGNGRDGRRDGGRSSKQWGPQDADSASSPSFEIVTGVHTFQKRTLDPLLRGHDTRRPTLLATIFEARRLLSGQLPEGPRRPDSFDVSIAAMSNFTEALHRRARSELRSPLPDEEVSDVPPLFGNPYRRKSQQHTMVVDEAEAAPAEIAKMGSDQSRDSTVIGRSTLTGAAGSKSPRSAAREKRGAEKRPPSGGEEGRPDRKRPTEGSSSHSNGASNGAGSANTSALPSSGSGNAGANLSANKSGLVHPTPQMASATTSVPNGPGGGSGAGLSTDSNAASLMASLMNSKAAESRANSSRSTLLGSTSRKTIKRPASDGSDASSTSSMSGPTPAKTSKNAKGSKNGSGTVPSGAHAAGSAGSGNGSGAALASGASGAGSSDETLASGTAGHDAGAGATGASSGATGSGAPAAGSSSSGGTADGGLRQQCMRLIREGCSLAQLQGMLHDLPSDEQRRASLLKQLRSQAVRFKQLELRDWLMTLS